MIAVGQKLPNATLYEFFDEERDGCSLGPNSFEVDQLTAGKKIVIFGFILGIIFSFILTFEGFNLIVLRIVIASGVAFLAGQLLDIRVFNVLRNKLWFIPPLVSSILGSVLDTVLFFSIAFYGTDSPWIILAAGDLAVKLFVDLAMLLPFRIAIARFS